MRRFSMLYDELQRPLGAKDEPVPVLTPEELAALLSLTELAAKPKPKPKKDDDDDEKEKENSVSAIPALAKN